MTTRLFSLLPSVLCLLFSVLCALGQTPAPAPLSMDPPENPGVINPALPTIFIASDSTAARAKEPQQGWGVPFADYFDLTKVNVSNRALGGRSSRTFITQGWWDKLLADLKAGDYVLIQFGHNDSSPINEEESVPPASRRSRGVIRSLGDETQEIVNILTKQPETIRSYGWYMRKMIADVQAKGATPIVLSITVRNSWKDGKVDRVNGPWREFSRQLAATAGIAYIDLTRLIADEYQRLSPDKVKKFFPRDATHTGLAGADLNASLVVSGLKGIRRGPFAAWLSPKGAAVAPDRIGYLNLPEPADPKLPSIILVGDSLVRNGRGDGAGGQWGWGDSLGNFFDPAKVNIVNRAVGGLSSRTYLTQGHWERALTLTKPGDFVVIQLGHNDSSPVNEDASTPPQSVRARGTLKGVGEEVEEVASNILTKQPETVHTYGWYIRKIVREARAAGATPIVTSLTPRKTWKDGKIVRSGADGYGGWARQVAEQEGVAFIDTNDLIATRYEALGAGQLDPLFGDPNLHTSKAGADLNAEILATELKKLPALSQLGR
ncbi:MAG TPA: rhamnogalacturonan acetylesterase [Lacunisphaera sp.]